MLMILVLSIISDLYFKKIRHHCLLEVTDCGLIYFCLSYVHSFKAYELSHSLELFILLIEINEK